MRSRGIRKVRLRFEFGAYSFQIARGGMDELTKRDGDLRIATENDLRRHRLFELQCKAHKIPDVDVTDSLGFHDA